MNHYTDIQPAPGTGVDDWQDGHRIATLAQAVGVVLVGRGCLRCQWVAAGMVIRCADRVPADVVAKARAIRGRAMPTRHAGRGFDAGDRWGRG